jgi:hypothetical protein
MKVVIYASLLPTVLAVAETMEGIEDCTETNLVDLRRDLSHCHECA